MTAPATRSRWRMPRLRGSMRYYARLTSWKMTLIALSILWTLCVGIGSGWRRWIGSSIGRVRGGRGTVMGIGIGMERARAVRGGIDDKYRKSVYFWPYCMSWMRSLYWVFPHIGYMALLLWPLWTKARQTLSSRR